MRRFDFKHHLNWVGVYLGVKLWVKGPILALRLETWTQLTQTFHPQNKWSTSRAWLKKGKRPLCLTICCIWVGFLYINIYSFIYLFNQSVVPVVRLLHSIRCGPHICFLRYHRCTRGVNFEILQPQCDTDNKSESQTTAAVSLLFYVPILFRPVFMIPHSDFVVSLFSKFLPWTWFWHFDASPWQSGSFVFLNVTPLVGWRCCRNTFTNADILGQSHALNIKSSWFFCQQPKPALCKVHSSVTVYSGNRVFWGLFPFGFNTSFVCLFV